MRIDDPKNLNMNIIPKKGAYFDKLKEESAKTARRWLERTNELTNEIVLERYRTF